MIIALPFHEGDKIQAVRLAEWITELGHNARHQCLVVHHKATDASEVLSAIKPAFRNVVDMAIPDRDPCQKIQGGNVLFRRVAYQVEATGQEPWLWLEPDAVPLHPDWADVIADAFAANHGPRTQFLGTATGARMDAVGVYPRNSVSIAPRLVHCENLTFSESSRATVFPRLFKTGLIQQGGAAALADLRPGAVLFHSDKDGVLIPLLRAAGICRQGAVFAPAPAKEHITKPAPAAPSAPSGPERALAEGDGDAHNGEDFPQGAAIPAPVRPVAASEERKGPTVHDMKRAIRKAIQAGVIKGYNLTQISNMTAPGLKVVMAEIEASEQLAG